MEIKTKDFRVGNYILGIRFDFEINKYKIIVGLTGWENNCCYIDKTSFAKTINYKTEFDSEEEADYYRDIIVEQIGDWNDYVAREKLKSYKFKQ